MEFQSTLSRLGISRVSVTLLIALIAGLYFLNLSSPVFINFIVLPVLSLFLAVLGAAWAFLHSRPSQPLPSLDSKLLNPNFSLPDALQSRSLYPDTPTDFPLLVSKGFDLQLQAFIDRVLESYLLPVYSRFGSDRYEFRLAVRLAVWGVIEKMTERLMKVDYVTLLTRDIIVLFTQHMQLVRNTGGARQKWSEHIGRRGPSTNQNLHSCLQSNETEIDFLRQITEVILCDCLKEEDMRCEPLRILLREYIVNQVIYPIVKFITDPDVINQKIVEWLNAQENLRKTRDSSYTYARTYEGFIKVINQCPNPEELVQIRYNIMLEIMQATALRNKKYAQETKQDILVLDMQASQGHGLRRQNPHKYINQCRCALTLCERRLKQLTGESPVMGNHVSDEPRKENPVKMVYPESMREILDSDEMRAVLLLFLERRDDSSLCHLWLALEELETQFYLDNDIRAIFDGFLEPDSANYVKLMSSKVELFAKFSTTHEGRFLILFKEYIVQEMKERFFSHFIESSEYQDYIMRNHHNLTRFSVHREYGRTQSKDSGKGRPGPGDRETSVMDSKLSNLCDRRDAISKHLDTSLNLTADDALSLRKAYEDLDAEVKEMEHYMDRTSDWVENMGNWRVEISNVEIDPRHHDPANPVYIIMVSPNPEVKGATSSKEQALGWVIPRTYKDFSELHQALAVICPSIKKEFPVPVNTFSNILKRHTSSHWEVQMGSLNQYLQVVMSEQVLQESEALYSFLSPASGQFKQAYTFEDRPFKLSLTNVFKNPFSNDDFLDDDMPKEQLAEYIFELIHEVFELDGTLFKWIRRQIISIAQASFGGSIDRQLRLSAVWLVSEPMLTFYLDSLQEGLFDANSSFNQTCNRSDEEKTRSREQAYNLLQTMLPDFFQDILGSDNARRGLNKLFKALQDPILNKHLLYSVLEQLIITCIPEIKQL